MLHWIVLICLPLSLILMLIYLYLVFSNKRNNETIKSNKQEPQQITINLKPLEDKINEMPNKILQSITGSVNRHKGTVGELIGYIQLKANYDRIVPLGNIVDFMCIKFPEENNEGKVDFIDIKTGKYSKLNKDQKLLQQLITDKKINFVKMKVDLSDNNNSTD